MLENDRRRRYLCTAVQYLVNVPVVYSYNYTIMAQKFSQLELGQENPTISTACWWQCGKEWGPAPINSSGVVMVSTVSTAHITVRERYLSLIDCSNCGSIEVQLREFGQVWYSYLSLFIYVRHRKQSRSISTPFWMQSNAKHCRIRGRKDLIDWLSTCTGSTTSFLIHYAKLTSFPVALDHWKKAKESEWIKEKSIISIQFPIKTE